MKIGVLHFSYSKFKHFEKQFQATGHYSVNLGDYMQTLAVRSMLRQNDIPEEDIVSIDRERLREYDGPPVLLIMNACFYQHCFPISEQIVPLFIGFQAKAPVIRKQRDYLKTFEPIGCRDQATYDECRKLGINAYISGCLTLSFPSREGLPTDDQRNIYCVFGEGAGRFPAEMLRHAPNEVLTRCTFVSQRREMVKFPLDEAECNELEIVTERLLDKYRRTAERVITPLHHAATPCMATGIPVILCRSEDDNRFSWLNKLTPVYIAPHFSDVNWTSSPVDILAIKKAQNSDLMKRLEATLGSGLIEFQSQ